MFPKTNEKSSRKREDIISTSSELSDTPFYNWGASELVLTNGSPKLIKDVDAIKQWIILFVTTPKYAYKIYEGTSFGTSIRKLFGRKVLGNGYEESEIERELREGLILCPAISRVVGFSLNKKGRNLSVWVQVELFDGEFVDTSIEDVYIIK